jgi:FlaA1/EpsC-like NDP-sugar epimerase
MDTNKFIKKFLNRDKSFFADDLKDRSEILRKEIFGKNVLVIGGAGTIGSSFIKVLLFFRPRKVVVVDTNENELTELIRDLRSSDYNISSTEIITYPASLGTKVFNKLFIGHGPYEIVANFAAHKHVRSEKDIYSIEALLWNNLINAKELMDLLTEFKPNHFFCVSTDKAANPVNIMGASKFLMEDLIFSYSEKFKVSTARFANVAFSNGSLLYGFLRRIEKQQPISCPSDVRRFIVSAQEAGEICLLAAILGDSSEIYFPNFSMQNDLINFADILPSFLAEYGYIPKYCATENEAKKSMYLISKGIYPVYIVPSETSGEKLYEEFYTDDEDVSFGKYSSIGVIKKQMRYSNKEISGKLNDLEQLFNCDELSKIDIVSWLKDCIPNFNHIETGKSLDSKM